jgi:hypothetical protein
MSENKGDRCEICGKNLIYAISTEDCKELICAFCNKKEIVNTYCIDHHYICNLCHAKGAIEIIKEVCENTELKDPFQLADLIMKHHKFNMYGPEHHVLTPAVILTILKNNNIKKPDGNEITFSDIKGAITRASAIPGGWCGFYGSCGAGMGSGVAISIFTGATPAKNKPRTLANQMTSRALNKIADNLEHCCKRSVKLSLCETLNFLDEKFGIKLNYTPNRCSFSEINDKCETVKCPLF